MRKHLGLIVLMVAWAVLAGWVITEAQSVFTPTTDFTNQFSTYMKSPLAKAIGLIAMAGLALAAIETRGHGVAIFGAMIVVAVVLAFMFNAEKTILPMLGYQG